MRVLIRQKIKPEHLDWALESLREVYAELETLRPQHLRYDSHQLDDPHEFVSIVDTDDPASLRDLPVFQRYRAELDDRCDEPPSVTVLHEVATYP